MKQALGNSLKAILVAVLTGLCMGTVSALFLNMLSFVTSFREQYPIFILGLPAVGCLTAFVYTKFGKNSQKGNNLIIDSTHENDTAVPARMGILTFLFTGLSHLVGASVGREGTAVQIGGVIGNKLSDIFKLDGQCKKVMILSGISAGFGSVFGTPFAGAFFGMEMTEIGRFRYEGMFACFTASFVSNAVTEYLGVTHQRYSLEAVPPFSLRLLAIVMGAAICFGLVARLFSTAVHKLKYWYGKMIPQLYIRALVSVCVVLLLNLIFHTVRYNGLSTWMIDAGFKGENQWYDPFLKFMLTVASLGAGFQGGEATPLFDIGASLGGIIGHITQISPSLPAALGYIAVFGNGANIPLTTIILGIELFGADALPYYALVAIIGYYVTGHHSIYGAQRIATPKYTWKRSHKDKKVQDVLL